MSGCRIKRNLNPSGNSTSKEECSKEVDDALAKMLEERKRQDETLNTVLSEKEYSDKYGKQPEANAKK